MTQNQIEYELSIGWNRRTNNAKIWCNDSYGSGDLVAKVETLDYDYDLVGSRDNKHGIVVKTVTEIVDRDEVVRTYDPVGYVEPKQSVDSFRSNIESALITAMADDVEKDVLDSFVPDLVDEIISNYDLTYLEEICEGDSL